MLFNILGGKQCINCNFTDVRALQFDHIDSGGTKEVIDKFQRTSFYMHKYYTKHPKEAKQILQVLCVNCNWIKRTINGECLRNKIKDLTEKQIKMRKNKSKQHMDRNIRMYNLLGGSSCKHCGITNYYTLQLDHIYGSCKEDVREFGDYDKMLTFYFANPEIAIRDLQVLCANCNWIKRSTNNELTNNSFKS